MTRDTDRQLFDLATHQKNEPKTQTQKIEKPLTAEVIIEEYDSPQKIALIKVIKTLTNLEVQKITQLLKTLPVSIIKVNSEQAEQIKKNLTEVGAKVTLKK